LRVLVIVTNLGSPGRHEFLNDAEVLVADQVPSVTIDSPAIVLGVFAADGEGLI
jgi:hypothetical protein